MSTTCKVCTSDNPEDIEKVGLQALSGELSWRAAAKAVGWTNYASIKTHMEHHYVAAQERAVQDEMDASIEESIRELRAQFAVAPPEVKPLLLAAIHNVRELRNTKPSQQHLIQALKTVQEMTGMKHEQRILLGFAERMFGSVEAPKAIDNIIDAVTVDEAPLPDTDETANASKPRRRRAPQKA